MMPEVSRREPVTSLAGPLPGSESATEARVRARWGSLTRRARNLSVSLVVLLCGLGVWQFVSTAGLFPSYALPGPGDVWTAFVSLTRFGFAGQSLWSDMTASLYRIALGFVLAAAVGIPLGVAMGRSVVLFRIVDPFVEFFRPVPPLAYIPLFVVWFGIGETPKILLIAVGTAPVIIINAMSGVRSTPPVRLRVAQCLGASRWQIFWHVVLPSAMPEIFTGLRVANAIAWTTLVASELIAANSGLGWLAQNAGEALRVPIVIVAIILIGLLGYLTEILVRAAERLLVPWKGRV